MRLEIFEDKNDDRKDDIFKLKLKQAKQRYLNLVYTFDRAREWQTKCAIELYKLAGNENLTSWSENGVSESYARAGLSQDLLNELPPAKAGVPS